MTILVHFSTDPEKTPDGYPERAAQRHAETNAFLRDNREALRKVGIHLVTAKCGPTTQPGGDYDWHYRSRWLERGPLLGLEADVVPPSVESLVELAACPHEWCAFDYLITRCHMTVLSSDNPKEPVTDDGKMKALVCWLHQAKHPASRVFPNGNPREGRWAQEEEEWVDMAPLGMVKFSQSLRWRLGTNWPLASWLMLDTRLSNWLSSYGVRCHIHRPLVKHNHVAPAGHYAGELSTGEEIPTAGLDELSVPALRAMLSKSQVKEAYRALGRQLPEY